jgi:hypothetical protein
MFSESGNDAYFSPVATYLPGMAETRKVGAAGTLEMVSWSRGW